MRKILILIVLFLTSFVSPRDGMIFHSCDSYLLNQKYYIVCYNDKHHVPNWVSYKLTNKMVNEEATQSAMNFRTDSANFDISPSSKDYTNSGYDRGHLVPAEDMDWLFEAFQKTYLMTNVAPQDPSFNRGLWKRLENKTREWAIQNEEVYVTSGVLVSNNCKTIANGKISVPSHFYKIILDKSGPEIKMIAFIMKNEANGLPLTSFITTVDKLETITGYDFYSALPDGIEDKIESSQDTTGWHF